MPNQKDKVLNYQTVLSDTQDKESLKVTLNTTQAKGVGLFATKPIYKDETIVFYRIKVYQTKAYISKTGWKYACEVYDKKGESMKHLIGDIYPKSVPPPVNGIPYWGHFSNEPSIGEISNAQLNTNTRFNYRDRYKIKAGDTMIYELKATRYIAPGDEVLWWYGSNYGRDYPVSKL